MVDLADLADAPCDATGLAGTVRALQLPVQLNDSLATGSGAVRVALYVTPPRPAVPGERIVLAAGPVPLVTAAVLDAESSGVASRVGVRSADRTTCVQGQAMPSAAAAVLAFITRRAGSVGVGLKPWWR